MPRQKYEQIYSILKGQIEAGDYPVGGLLPSENVLIGEFQCSRNTVRRALANLVRDGYVQTRQGWGVCNIYQPIETSAYTMGTIESFAETARRTGQNSATRVVLFTTCTADEALSRRTGFPPGTELFYLQRVHDLDGVPRIFEGDRPGLHLPLSGAGGPYVHCHQQAHHHRGDGGRAGPDVADLGRLQLSGGGEQPDLQQRRSHV